MKKNTKFISRVNMDVLENVSIKAPRDTKNSVKFISFWDVFFSFIVSNINIYADIELNNPDNAEEVPGLKGNVALIDSSKIRIPSAKMYKV